MTAPAAVREWAVCGEFAGLHGVEVEPVDVDGETWGLQFHRTTAAASCPITRQQVAVLTLMAEGLQNAEIGVALGISQDTVKAHAHRAFRAIGARNRAHAVLIGLQSGWLQ